MSNSLDYWSLPLGEMRLRHMTETPSGIVIGLETEGLPQGCPVCRSKKVVGYGQLNLRIRDLPINNKAVMLDIRRRRLRCNHCGVTFNQPIAHISERHRATTRLVQKVWKSSLSMPFAHLAKVLGVDEKTIRNIFNNTYVAKLHQFQMRSYPHTHQAAIAVYPLTILRKPRLLWVHCQQNCLIEINANINAEDLSSSLQRFAPIATLYLPMELGTELRATCAGLTNGATIVETDQLAHHHPATYACLADLTTLVETRLAKRSFEVFCANALLDKTLHKTTRTGIDPQATNLRYQKANFGTDLTRLIAKLERELPASNTAG